MLHTIKTVAREEGVLALWKGNVPAQLMVMSFVSIKFAAYGHARTLLQSVTPPPWWPSRRGESRDWERVEMGGFLPEGVVTLVAGGVAGALATAGTYPLDLMRTRLASNPESGGRVALRELSAVMQRDGARGFYKGLRASLAGIVPCIAIQLSTYEASKKAYLNLMHGRSRNDDRIGLLPSTALGAFAGGVSKLATLPLDLCKKRMQMDMASGSMRKVSTPVANAAHRITERIQSHDAGWCGRRRSTRLQRRKACLHCGAERCLPFSKLSRRRPSPSGCAPRSRAWGLQLSLLCE